MGEEIRSEGGREAWLEGQAGLDSVVNPSDVVVESTPAFPVGTMAVGAISPEGEYSMYPRRDLVSGVPEGRVAGQSWGEEGVEEVAGLLSRDELGLNPQFSDPGEGGLVNSGEAWESGLSGVFTGVEDLGMQLLNVGPAQVGEDYPLGDKLRDTGSILQGLVRPSEYESPYADASGVERLAGGLLQPDPGDVARVGAALLSPAALARARSVLTGAADNLLNSGLVPRVAAEDFTSRIYRLSDDELDRVTGAVDAIRSNADELNASIAEGGFSLDLDEQRLAVLGKATGHAAGVFPELSKAYENYQPSDVSDILTAFVIENGPYLSQRGLHVGGWVDDANTMWTDVSMLGLSREEALELGEWAGQQSVVDMANIEFIDTGGTGYVPIPEGLSPDEKFWWSRAEADKRLEYLRDRFPEGFPVTRHLESQ